MTLAASLTRFGAIAASAILAEAATSRGNPPDSVTRVASLSAARAAHTATALSSGRVLVAGGMESDGGSLASAELYDPATNGIQAIGRLAQSRSGHSATRLPDGRVLIVGGYNGEYLSSIEVFDPSGNTFRAGGALRQERSGHTATLMPDGRILFVGGLGSGWTFLRSAEIYDPATGRSDPVGSMTAARESHTTTLLADGRVLVVGGHQGRRQNMQVFASAEVFDPTTRRFAPAGTMALPRHKHDAVRLADGRVLIIAGADRTDRAHYPSTEIYDPQTGRFTPGPPMHHPRYKIAGTSVVLSTGEVLVTSGAVAAEILDAKATGFREVPGRLPEAYRFASATPTSGGDVIIMGGYSDDNRTTAGVWRFTRKPSPP